MGLENIIKVMTLNLCGARGSKKEFFFKSLKRERIKENLDKVVNFILESETDVALLQEVGFGSTRTAGIDQAAYLAEKTGYYHSSAVNISLGGRVLGIGYSFRTGNAIISRHPFEDSEKRYFRKKIPFVSKVTLPMMILPNFLKLKLPFYVDEHKSFQITGINYNGRKVTLINTHLESRNHVERGKQAEILLQYVSEIKTPYILGGDLNSIPEHAPVKYNFVELYEKDDNDDYRNDDTTKIFKREHDSKRLRFCDKIFPDDGKYPEEQNTHPVEKPNRILDYILCGGGAKFPKDGEYGPVWNIRVSDHFPVIAEIKIPRLPDAG